MTHEEPNESLPDEAELALAYTPPSIRSAFRVLLEFDARLSRLIAATTEPMLGQMRLAWWRETLAQPVEQRPQGDVVLDGIGVEWVGYEEALVPMVDGWEHLLADPPLSEEAATAFASGRAEGFAAFAEKCSLEAAQSSAAKRVGKIWAFADAASHIGDAAERAALVRAAINMGKPPRLPRPLRGVAVLGALAHRSIQRGGLPLMDGRGAALVAMRAGLAGR